jgi:glycosyltransferase involved in cell wall biosynthesis
MRVDVIVSTYNRAEMLREALESLARQELGEGCSLEILVVDNASTDATRAVVESFAARSRIPVKYFCEPAQGVAHARRRGVREATAEWLAFFDDDQLADRCWLKELVAVARASGTRCVGGRVTLAEVGAGPSLPLPPFCRALLGESPRAETPGPYTGKSLPGTGNVLVHASVFEAVGPFDAALEQGAEDAEFFRRVRRAGFSMWYAPRARVSHRAPAYRTTREYLVWVARRHGAAYATIDAKEGGRGRVVWNALLRAGQALAVTLPVLLRARVAADEAALLELQCRMARAVGYERQALRLVAPGMFAQPRFFEALDFRRERARFA